MTSLVQAPPKEYSLRSVSVASSVNSGKYLLSYSRYLKLLYDLFLEHKKYSACTSPSNLGQNKTGYDSINSPKTWSHKTL